MAELQPEAGPRPVVRECHRGRIGLAGLFRPQTGDLGASVLQQRGDNSLSGRFLFVFPPLAVFPDGETAGPVFTEKALPALGDGPAAPWAAAHRLAGGGEQNRAALYHHVLFHIQQEYRNLPHGRYLHQQARQ